MTQELLSRTNNVADLLQLQIERELDDALLDEVVESVVGLGLTEEEAGQAMSMMALLVYKAMPLQELRYLVYAAVKKVLTQREVSYG